MRKKGFKRQQYTVMHNVYDVNLQEWYWVYLRGTGSINPTPRVDRVSAPSVPEEQFDIQAEIDLYTRDPYPVMESDPIGQNLPDDYIGANYRPSRVIWNGVDYATIALDPYSRLGCKNDYRKASLFYSAKNSSIEDVPILDLDWKGLDDFYQAVNSTEMVVELKMSKVLED